MSTLEPGLTGEKEIEVTREVSATHMGSGDVGVFATPAMVGLVERTALELVQAHLQPDQTTVGVEVHLAHLAATPVGMRVRARVELTRVEGRLLTFKAEVYDEKEKVGEGSHRRAIIEKERFMKRVQAKAGRDPSAPRGPARRENAPDSPGSMRYHIWTEGCQMNVADSQRVARALEQLGYTLHRSAEEADVIVLNTCVVRQSAEDKAYGRLTSLRPLKGAPEPGHQPDGLPGRREGEPGLARAFPYVDVFSPPSDPRPLLEHLAKEQRVRRSRGQRRKRALRSKMT